MRNEYLPLLSPSPGSQRRLKVIYFGEDLDLPLVYLQAGLHADEWPGLLVMQHIIPMLEQLELAGKLRARICLVPFANPIGLGQQVFGYTPGRFDLFSGQNFNRRFPMDLSQLANLVREQLSNDQQHNVQLIKEALQTLVRAQPEATELQFLHKTLMGLSISADLVLDLHCEQSAIPHLYSSNLQQEQGALLARCMEFPLLLVEDTLGEVAFDGTHIRPWLYLQKKFPKHPIPIPCFASTLELRGKQDVGDELALQDAQGLIRYLSAAGYIDQTVQVPEVNLTCSQLNEVQVIRSPSTGLIQIQCPLGQQVVNDQLIAELVQIDADEANSRVPIKAETNGLLFVQTNQALVRAGTIVAMIAGDEPFNLRTTQLNS